MHDQASRFNPITGAEAALAMEIGAGRSVKMAADRLGITYATARSNLKIIFGKANVHRQVELIALLAKLGV